MSMKFMPFWGVLVSMEGSCVASWETCAYPAQLPFLVFCCPSCVAGLYLEQVLLWLGGSQYILVMGWVLHHCRGKG